MLSVDNARSRRSSSQCLRSVRFVYDLEQLSLALGLVTISDCFDEQVAKPTFPKQLAQDVENASSEGLPLKFDLFEQALIDVTLARLFGKKILVAGSKLFIPVHAAGALFEVGDGHAGQGNGEVDITAMETSLIGTFQFVLRKDMHLRWPRAETPTHFVVMGIDNDLTKAMTVAVHESIDFLITEKHLSREDAYMLSSVAVDFDVTQVVYGTKGIHGMIPKSIFE